MEVQTGGDLIYYYIFFLKSMICNFAWRVVYNLYLNCAHFYNIDPRTFLQEFRENVL